MNAESGTYQPYSNPGPIENFLYIPTRDGKGAVSVDTVGGDVNVRDISDVELFSNRVFAGLKIPKAFLNFGDDSLSPFSGGETLTKLDARYARTIKMLQSYVIRGWQNLLDIFLMNRGMGNVIGNYTVEMVLPESSEDMARLNALSQRTDIARNFVDVISTISNETETSLNSEDLISYVSTTIYSDATISDIFESADNAENGSGVEGKINN